MSSGWENVTDDDMAATIVDLTAEAEELGRNYLAMGKERDALRAEVERLTESRRVIAGALEREEEWNAALEARVAELEAALKDIVANASIIPDPLMEGQADGYLVPMDDIETARAALAAEKGET